MSTHKTDIARVWDAAWNHGDTTVLETLLAPTYRRHTTRSTADLVALIRSIHSAREAFPDLRTTIEHIAEDGDLVAVHWSSTGTHTGPFHDLPVTGRRITTSGMTFARFVDGQVVEEWVSWDGADLFVSLGVVNLWES
ncbi:ester cyclase [Nocardia sp. CA-084685]|uniref:ester cyclase n=1 Tax=Nocardia sp. CA-084685 TaxID=3239970 RepID=UPI003D99A80F